MIIFSARLLKKYLNRVRRVSTLLSQNDTSLYISVTSATVLAANFGCNQFRIMLNIFFKLLQTAIRSGCAVLSEQNQTPFSGTGQGVNLTQLLCTGFDLEHLDLFICFTFA